MALLKIFVGTMYGGSLDVAEQVQPLFEQAGYTVEVLDQPTLTDLTETRLIWRYSSPPPPAVAMCPVISPAFSIRSALSHPHSIGCAMG